MGSLALGGGEPDAAMLVLLAPDRENPPTAPALGERQGIVSRRLRSWWDAGGGVVVKRHRCHFTFYPVVPSPSERFRRLLEANPSQLAGIQPPLAQIWAIRRQFAGARQNPALGTDESASRPAPREPV